MVEYPLLEIAEKVGAKVHGDGAHLISHCASLQNADASAISFLDNPRYRHYLHGTHAGAVILRQEELEHCPTNALITHDPYFTFAKVAELYAPKITYAPGIHSSAIIGEGCQIDPSAYIGPYSVLEAQVTIGEHTVIKGQCFIGNNTNVGNHTFLHPQVTIYHDTIIGAHCLIHSGVVIGSDGFGYAKAKTWHKIPQLGRVVIQNHVEIGANTVIDRATLETTVIHEGVKIDNLVQVAHNVKIGEHTAIAGCVGIAGSATIGKHCLIGGATGVGGHIEVTDNVAITGMTMVTKSITEPGVYSSGTGLQKNAQWRKNVARFHHLNELALKVKNLEDRLKKLETD